MLSPDKVFDDMYEYADLWAGGYIKAYLPKIEAGDFIREKQNFVAAIMERIGVVNRLRKSINLPELTIDEAYDYYINNMPEFDDATNSIDLISYSVETDKLAQNEVRFSRSDKPSVKSMLTIMGAPEVYLENSHVIQERVDHVNRLLNEGGYPSMDAKKTEEMLIQLLLVNI